MSSTTENFAIENLPLLPIATILENVRVSELLSLAAVPHIGQFVKQRTTPKVEGFMIELLHEFKGLTVFGDRGFHKRSSSDTLEQVIQRYSKLTAMFKGPLSMLRLDSKFVGQLEKQLEIRECDVLHVISNEEQHDEEALDSFLDKVEVRDLFLFHMNNYSIKNQKLLSVDHLHMANAMWMTQEDLLKCDSKRMHIGDNRFTENDVNAFILQWLNGGNNRLEVAIFESSRGQDWDEALLLSGLSLTTFHRDNRDRIYLPKGHVPDSINEEQSSVVWMDEVDSGVDLIFAHDIQRADGTFASLEFNQHSGQFRIFVWKEQFPSNRVISKLEGEIEELKKRIQQKEEFKDRIAESGAEKLAVGKDIGQLEKELTHKKRMRLHLCIQ